MTDDLHFRNILDGLFEGLYCVDRERKIIYWNKGAERITGYKAAEVLGSSCADNILVHVDGKGNNLCRSGCPLTEAIRSGGHHFENSLYLHHKDGQRVPVAVSVSAIRNERGNIIRAAEIFNDSAESLRNAHYIDDLKKAALLDFLTSLPNRRHIETKLLSAVQERRRHGTEFAVFFIDLDHFKRVNDTYGHDVGDKVIKMVARTLENNMRAYNMVGRWGGEEFVAVVSHISAVNARLLGEKLRSLIENSFLVHEGHIIRITATIGSTLLRRDDTQQSVLKRVDSAMYKGKNAGRNRSVFEEETTGS